MVNTDSKTPPAAGPQVNLPLLFSEAIRVEQLNLLNSRLSILHAMDISALLLPSAFADTCSLCPYPGTVRCMYCPSAAPVLFCSVTHYHEHWWTVHQPVEVRPRADHAWVDDGAPDSPTVSVPSSPITVSVCRHTVTSYLLGAYSPHALFLPISCYTVKIAGIPSWIFPDLSTSFPDGCTSLVLHFDRFKVPLVNPFHLFYCPYAYVQRTPYNRAIAELASSDSSTTQHTLGWPGTVVILKFTSARCSAYEDMTLSDVPDIRAYFTTHAAMWVHELV